jgi:hypothetical protein
MICCMTAWEYLPAERQLFQPEYSIHNFKPGDHP